MHTQVGLWPGDVGRRVQAAPQPTTADAAIQSIDGQRPRLAAIDVGSNSIRLIVAEVEDDGSYRILDDERETTRLAAGLARTGQLSPEAVARSIETVTRMKAIADGLQVSRLRAIATSAVREASNGQDFCEEVLRRVGVAIEIVSPEEEAHLAFRSAARHFHLNGHPAAIVDIGGGSVEVILVAGTVVDEVYSLPLGAVRTTERFHTDQPLRKQQRKEVCRALDRQLYDAIGKPPLWPQVMIGSGGTFTTLAEIAQARRHEPALTVQGYRLPLAEIEMVLDELLRMTVKERREVPGMNPARADILVAGALVITRLAKYLNCEEVWVHEKGIRDGLLLSMMTELAGPGDQRETPLERIDSVRRFARKCRCREAHSEHVATLAATIFQGLRGPLGLSADHEDLLRAAALLHEAGHVINQESYHKHSYHVIRHAELPGFDAHEVELIANIARYHRGALPKSSHEHFAPLSAADGDLVRLLAGILRVADALDRTRFQRVRGVQAELTPDTLRLHVDAGPDAQVEIWDAQDKAKLLEKALRRTVVIEGRSQGTGVRGQESGDRK
jgi:exopolyphosphatase/guanosine-5'-triphosphate,3'-diphosphate pyrophosphatase